MKNKTQHATLQQGNTEPRSHGSEASQLQWQGNIAALRQGSKLPSFRASESAFDAVAENRFTYGKPAAAPKGPKVITNSYGMSCSSEKCPKDKQQDSKWVRDYVPRSEAIEQQRDLSTPEQFCRVTWSHGHSDSANEIRITAYGKALIFLKTHKQKATYGDSRFEKPQPIAFAKIELRRMLGVSEGDRAYELLCNPAALLPISPQPVADEQGIIMPASI